MTTHQLILFAYIFLVTIPLNESQCGIPHHARNELIVNGHDTVPGEWPWHTAIYHKSPGKRTYEYACGGTLISEQYVLTAAHCVTVTNGFTISKNLIFVRLGVHDLNVLNPESIQQHNVLHIHLTGTYPRPSSSRKDDIALIELNSLAEFNDFVQPACINQEANLTGLFGTALGWGVTENDTISAVLKKAEMPTIDTFTCLESDRTLFGQTLDRGIFCAGFQNGTTVCNGDSGGGLFFNQGGAWYVGGITSFSAFRDGSHFCSLKNYAAFTDVYHFLPWIYNTTKIDKSSRFNLLPEDCGESVVERIPQGNITKVFAYPWMARLHYRKNGKIVYGCDGTLINNRYILTGAICLVHEVFKGLLYAVLGEHTANQDIDCNIVRNDKGDEIDRKCAGPIEYAYVQSFEAHPEYEDEPDFKHNIGLIRLKKAVVMKDHIRPICLPVTSELRFIQLDSYVIVGWGHSTKHSNTQMEVTVSWVNNSDCKQVWAVTDRRLTVAKEDICVRDQVVSPCFSIVGTPLGSTVNHNGTRFVQFGVKNIWHQIGNCTNTSVPTAFTNVGSHMDWILATIKP